jgi:hypothetical protein
MHSGASLMAPLLERVKWGCYQDFNFRAYDGSSRLPRFAVDFVNRSHNLPSSIDNHADMLSHRRPALLLRESHSTAMRWSQDHSHGLLLSTHNFNLLSLRKADHRVSLENPHDRVGGLGQSKVHYRRSACAHDAANLGRPGFGTPRPATVAPCTLE